MRWQTEIKDTVGRHHRGPLFNAWAKPKGTGQQFSPLFTTWRCLATQPTPLARGCWCKGWPPITNARLRGSWTTLRARCNQILRVIAVRLRGWEFACSRVVPTGFTPSSTRDIYLTLRRCHVWSLWLLMKMREFGKQVLEGWKCERERSIFGEWIFFLRWKKIWD